MSVSPFELAKKSRRPLRFLGTGGPPLGPPDARFCIGFARRKAGTGWPLAKRRAGIHNPLIRRGASRVGRQRERRRREPPAAHHVTSLAVEPAMGPHHP